MLTFLMILALQAQSTDQVVKALEDKEAEATTGPLKVGMGDDYFMAVKKVPTQKKKLLEKATYWYIQAWPDLDGVWRDKMRDRFHAIFNVPAIQVPKGNLPPASWTFGTDKICTLTGCSHLGGKSVIFFGAKDKHTTALRQVVVLRPKMEYELSGWVLTDGTDSADDELYAPGYSTSGKLILHPKIPALPDQPWWKRISSKFTAPEDAAKLEVTFSMTSTKGIAILDDVSLMGSDGKEVLKNPSFEQ
jgi:hypothetical protein